MKLIGSCSINMLQVEVNGELKKKLSDSEDWKKELYSSLALEYPKFYKMDNLAKLAFLSFQFLKPTIEIEKYADDEIAMIFANKSSSLTTDEKYKESYLEKGSPSPSLFVYTLPNILTGELSILNKWYGENIFFINENFDAAFFIEQINFYFRKGVKACLCGWIEASLDNEECFLFFVKNEKGELTANDLYTLFK